MAKSKNGKSGAGFEAVQPFSIEEPLPDGSIDGPGAPADDRDEKIAALERELADLRAAQSQAPAVAMVAPQVVRHFKVDLQHASSRVVKAVDSANAFQEFFRKSGIIASDFQPSAAEHAGPCGVFLPDGSFRPDTGE